MAGGTTYTIITKESKSVEDLEEFATDLCKEKNKSNISILEKDSSIVLHFSRIEIVEGICKEFKDYIIGVGKVSAETTYGSVHFVGYNIDDEGSLEIKEEDSKNSFPVGYSHRWKGVECPAPTL